MLKATLTLVGRRRRELSRLIVPALVLTLASLFLIISGTDMVYTGEFSDIWNRVNPDGRSFWTQEYREQLVSIEMNLTSWGLPMLIIGAIVYLLVTLVYLASVSWICASDLIERPCSAVEALRWGIARLFRVSALCVHCCNWHRGRRRSRSSHRAASCYHTRVQSGIRLAPNHRLVVCAVASSRRDVDSRRFGSRLHRRRGRAKGFVIALRCSARERLLLSYARTNLSDSVSGALYGHLH